MLSTLREHRNMNWERFEDFVHKFTLVSGFILLLAIMTAFVLFIIWILWGIAFPPQDYGVPIP